MPELLPVLVGLLGGVAGLLLPRVLSEARDAVALAAVVTAVALVATDLAPLAVCLGIAAVVFGGSAGRRFVAPAVLAGTVLTAVALKHGSPTHLRTAVVLVAVAALVAARRSATSLEPWVVPALLFTSAAAIYAAVPDTEQITAVGVMIGILTIGVVLGIVAGPTERATAWVALPTLVVWASGVGAAGRPAAFGGAVAALGLLWALPLWRPTGCRLPPVALLSVHVGIAGVAARTAGIDRSTVRAWSVAAALLAVSLAVGVVGRRPAR